jgi:ParB-like chromosome segregation protein Spo0J
LIATIRNGHDEILARVLPESTPQAERLGDVVHENLHAGAGRVNLPADVARYKAELGGSNRDLARKLKISESEICKLLKLSNTDAQIQALIEKGLLCVRGAYALARIEDAELRRTMTDRAVKEGWTADETEREARAVMPKAPRLRRLRLALGGGFAMSLECPRVDSPRELVKPIELAARALRKLADGGHSIDDFVKLAEMQFRDAEGAKA